jgi:hypothetical protein
MLKKSIKANHKLNCIQNKFKVSFSIELLIYERKVSSLNFIIKTLSLKSNANKIKLKNLFLILYAILLFIPSNIIRFYLFKWD